MSKLPEHYTYKPLPEGLTIKESDIDGLGLFTKKYLPEHLELGITHVDLEEELIRTPLGGMLNHSLSPNCVIDKKCNSKYHYLKTLSEIAPNEELTVDYFKSSCGNKTVL